MRGVGSAVPTSLAPSHKSPWPEPRANAFSRREPISRSNPNVSAVPLRVSEPCGVSTGANIVTKALLQFEWTSPPETHRTFANMQVIRKLSRSALWSNRANAKIARLLRRLDLVGPDDLAPADDFGVNHPGSSFWRLLRGRKYGSLQPLPSSSPRQGMLLLRQGIFRPSGRFSGDMLHRL